MRSTSLSAAIAPPCGQGIDKQVDGEASFEQTQETLAMLKILALGNQEVAGGKVKPVAEVIHRLRAKHASA